MNSKQKEKGRKKGRTDGMTEREAHFLKNIFFLLPFGLWVEEEEESQKERKEGGRRQQAKMKERAGLAAREKGIWLLDPRVVWWPSQSHNSRTTAETPCAHVSSGTAVHHPFEQQQEKNEQQDQQ